MQCTRARGRNCSELEGVRGREQRLPIRPAEQKNVEAGGAAPFARAPRERTFIVAPPIRWFCRFAFHSRMIPYSNTVILQEDGRVVGSNQVTNRASYRVLTCNRVSKICQAFLSFGSARNSRKIPQRKELVQCREFL